MNTDSFLRYLKDATFLHQITYEELKTLSLQYPYCQNLHLLLLKKSYLDNHKELDQNLTKAATYSVDRTQLYHQIQLLEQSLVVEDNFLLSEDYLELKELNEFEEPAAISAPPTASEDLKMNELPLINLEEELEEEDSSYLNEIFSEPALSEALASSDHDQPQQETAIEHRVEAVPSGDSDLSAQTMVTTAYLTNELMSDLIAIDKLLSKPIKMPSGSVEKISTPSVKAKQLRPKISAPVLPKLKQRDKEQVKQSRAALEKPKPAPELTNLHPKPKKSFNSWLRQFQDQASKMHLDEIMEHKKLEAIKKKKKKKKKKKHLMPPIAVQSITEHNDVASETLAIVLVNQGRYDKAIEMYERLILLFPEKNDYFAAKIDNLKSS